MKISLCIPTMDRWEFLQKNIPRYLENPYIDEIVISDENGNDAKLIQAHFNDPRIKVFVNEKRLGAFLNKDQAVSHATNELVCLMDSDNFAPLSYFEAFKEYLKGSEADANTVYMPAFTIPQKNHSGFNFNKVAGLIINIDNYKDIFKYNETLFNTGNYIINKTVYMNAVLNKDEEFLAEKCKALDVLFKNYLLLTRQKSTLIVVPNMSYDHIVHSGSYYLNTRNQIDSAYFNKLYK